MAQLLQSQEVKPAETGFSRVFINITAENSQNKLNELKNASTFQNLPAIVRAINEFKPDKNNEAEKNFKKNALEFALPFNMALKASEDTKGTGLSPEQTIKGYGKYLYRHNDCFTYTMKIINKSKDGLGPKSMRYSNSHAPPVYPSVAVHDRKMKNSNNPPVVWMTEQRYVRKRKDGSGDSMVLRPGDIVFIDHSKTGHNHYGVVTTDGKIANRTRGINGDKVEDFVAYATHVSVRHPYGVEYAESYLATRRVDNGKIKYDITKINTEFSAPAATLQEKIMK